MRLLHIRDHMENMADAVKALFQGNVAELFVHHIEFFELIMLCRPQKINRLFIHINRIASVNMNCLSRHFF